MTKPDSGSDSERALFLTPEAPYPLHGGGALRAASLLEYLARRYEVDVIAFREPGTPHPMNIIPNGLAHEIHAIDLPYHRTHVAARVVRNALRAVRRVPPLMDRFAGFEGQIASRLAGRMYDLGVVEHFWCAPYWNQIAPHCRRTVLDLHNIESMLHQRCGSVESWPARLAHGVFRQVALGLEHRWLPRYSCLLAVSEPDAAHLRNITPSSQIIVYPNAIPFTALPQPAEEDVVVFTGNLEYHPNVSAVRFFRRNIWPHLRQRWPNLVWRLVGKNPHGVARHTRGDSRIQVTGPVPDALAELARAKVALVPLLAGSGTRFKIMEAWAAGRAVVSTTLGAEGLPARDGENILLADEPDAFAEAVSRLLASPDLRLRIGAAGRELFERECTWEIAWSKLQL